MKLDNDVKLAMWIAGLLVIVIGLLWYDLATTPLHTLATDVIIEALPLP